MTYNLKNARKIVPVLLVSTLVVGCQNVEAQTQVDKTITSTSIAGGKAENQQNDSVQSYKSKLFNQSYVHTIDIEISEEDWKDLLDNPLDKTKYIKQDNNIWISKTATIDPSVKIVGPAIIDENVEIRHCAYLRPNVIVGKNCVIGNSCELKNSIVFDNCQIPHFNYVGDSIIGYHSHLSAGVIVSNQKLDKSCRTLKKDNVTTNTSLNKMGAIIGNHVNVGCNSVIFPGTIINSNVTIYPLTRVRGTIEANTIVKSETEIIRKEAQK